MSTATIEGTGALRVCIFALAGERWAADIRCTREVVIVREFTVVPGVPEYVVGVANLRGVVLTIVDVRALLGLPAGPLGREMTVLVVEVGSGPVGVVVDAVLGLGSVAGVLPFGDTARPLRADLGVGLVRGSDGVATLLDIGKVLDALKRGVGEGSVPRSGGRMP